MPRAGPASDRGHSLSGVWHRQGPLHVSSDGAYYFEIRHVASSFRKARPRSYCLTRRVTSEAVDRAAAGPVFWDPTASSTQTAGQRP